MFWIEFWKGGVDGVLLFVVTTWRTKIVSGSLHLFTDVWVGDSCLRLFPRWECERGLGWTPYSNVFELQTKQSLSWDCFPQWETTIRGMRGYGEQNRHLLNAFHSPPQTYRCPSSFLRHRIWLFRPKRLYFAHLDVASNKSDTFSILASNSDILAMRELQQYNNLMMMRGEKDS